MAFASWIVVGAAFFAGRFCHAHGGSSPSVPPIPAIGRVFSPTHSGYGYLGPSEAEADDLLGFSCANDDLRRYASRGCKVSGSRLSLEAAEAAISRTLTPIFHHALRNQVFEYLCLQAAASAPSRLGEIPIPSCVQRGAALRSSVANLSSGPLTDAAVNRLPAGGADPARSPQAIASKLRAVQASFDPNRMAHAFLLHEQLALAESRYCPGTDNSGHLKCLDIRDQKGRLTNGYPTLFSPTANRAAVAEYRRAIELFIGTSGARPGESEGARRARGQRSIEEGIRRELNLRGLEIQYEDAEYSARRPGASAELLEAFRKMGDTVSVLKDSRVAKVAHEAGRLCDADLSSLASEYPQVVRQLVLEQKGGELAATKAVLCQSRLSEQIRGSDRESCIGVSGGPLGSSQPVRVHRTNWNWPFYAPTNYSVTRAADGKMRVTLHLNFAAGPGIGAATFSETVARWKEETEAYYNRQAATTTPRLSPPVRFEILAGTGSDEPLIQILRQDAPGRPILIDSANIDVNAPGGVLAHEFGHALGLDDEYSADYYPFNLLGEHDSVMNNAQHPRARLFPRHFRQILEPALRCAVTDGGSP